MSEGLESLIATVRENLDLILGELDRVAEEWLGKPLEEFTDEDHERLWEQPEIVDLFAQYERVQAHLDTLEQELARAERDTNALLAQSELDEDIQGGD